jgi:hypothetical protein
MFRKTAFVLIACGLAAVLSAACAGPTGKGEGDSCTSNDDCSSNLTCQPVDGRQGDFCCPTPADASSQSNCQAKPDGG